MSDTTCMTPEQQQTVRRWQNSYLPPPPELFAIIDAIDKRCVAAEAKEGPLNSERWTLDELLAELEKWKRIASGKTCVSFENLCFGASSLWHQTHRDNFRKIDRKPESLSRWVLEHAGCVKDDFPAQVLEIIAAQAERIRELEAINRRAAEDWAEEDTAIREQAKRVLPAGEVECEYSPPRVELVERIVDELVVVRTIAAESCESIVRCEGVRVSEGERSGWWDSCCLSHVVEAGDELVKLGLWERHPQGVGRRWFYRPVERERAGLKGGG